MSRSLTLILFTSIAYVAHGAQLFTASTVPQGISSACSNALLSDVNCSPFVSSLTVDLYYPESTLNRTCTDDCAQALMYWESNIATSCSGDSWIGYDDSLMPLTIISDLIRYNYNVSCIEDSGRYCNNVAAQAAYAADPASGDPVLGYSFASQNNTAGPSTNVSSCDICLIKLLQFKASSPYYDGPDLAAASLYQSKTSSCGVAGYPLTATSTLSFYSLPPSPEPTQRVCTKTYDVQPGDDCFSISTSQKIGTGWLLMDNNLEAFCNNFPTNGSLCIQDTCEVYTVQQNDTCSSIASEHNITETQLKSWNPVINSGCFNIRRFNGTQFCVSSPGTPYVPPSATSLASISPTTAAPVPSDVAQGTNLNCGQYYRVVASDKCNLIALKFGIAVDDFTFLNPELNSNCTNLISDESYCVAAVGDINTYSGRPGYISYTSVAPSSYTPFSAIPTATSTIDFIYPTALPIANGTRGDCNFYFNASVFQTETDFYPSPCALAADTYGVDLDDFGTWNQGLNVSSVDCKFTIGYQYCGKLYFGEATVDDTDPPEFPIRPGASPNCTYFADVDYAFSCQDVLDQYSISIQDFYEWNPSVGADCSSLWPQYAYCVDTSDYEAPSTTSSAAIPGPTQSGMIGTCNKYAESNSDGSCQYFAPNHNISLGQLYAWNSVLGRHGENCGTQFKGNEYYCVGVSGPLPAPGPTQQGVVDTCVEYSNSNPDETCPDFANHHGISTSDLYAWNPVLGANGENCQTKFWANEYYCIAVAGPPTKPSSTTSAAPTSTTNAIPSPTQSGIISTCNRYAKSNSDGSCQYFPRNHGISNAQFYAWNSAVGYHGEHCDQFLGNEYYCVGVSGPLPAPGPSQDGVVDTCIKYNHSNPGGSCINFAKGNNIALSDLYKWNAVLGPNGENCQTKFWANEWYCTAVAG